MTISQNRQLYGITWMIIHCFLIAVMQGMVRAIGDNFHVFQIVFFYSFVAFLLLLPFLFTGKRIKHLKTEVMYLHLSRALLGVTSLTMYFYAFTVIPLTQARAIALTGPLISSLVAVFFLKETMGWHRSLGLIVGFCGALLIVRPGTSDFSIVTIMVIGSVCMWAIIDIIIKVMSKTESTLTQLFYLTGFMSLFSFPGALTYWQTPSTLFEWLWFLILGSIFLVNIAAVYNAFKNADITIVMPFDFSGMVFTTLIAYFAFHEVIDTATAIGSVVIVVSSVYVARREAKKAKEIHAVIPQSEV